MENKEFKKLWQVTYQQVRDMHHKWGAKENTLFKTLKTLVEGSKSEKQLVGLVAWYINQNDPFYAKQAWSLGYFVSHYNKHLTEYRATLRKENAKNAISESHKKLHVETVKKTQEIFKKDENPVQSVISVLLEKYPNKTKRDLKHAIKLNCKIPFEKVRKNTAIALCEVFGKDAYLQAFKEIQEKKGLGVGKNVDKEQERHKLLLTQAKDLLSM